MSVWTGFGRRAFRALVESLDLQGGTGQVASLADDPPPDPATRRHAATYTDKRPANAGFFLGVFPPRAAMRRHAPTGLDGPNLDAVWTPRVRCACGHWLHARDVYEHLALVHGVDPAVFLDDEGVTEGGIA